MGYIVHGVAESDTTEPASRPHPQRTIFALDSYTASTAKAGRLQPANQSWTL